MACKNCGGRAPSDYLCCAGCPRTPMDGILERLEPNHEAESLDDDRAFQFRDPATGKSYYGLDYDGLLIMPFVDGPPPVALVEARR